MRLTITLLGGGLMSILYRYGFKVEMTDFQFLWVIPVTFATMTLLADAVDKLQDIREALRRGR